ncbi:MAG: hypothetical protein A4E28_03032 [Methanocella sp. PtaU1.Bin125]|nr:MAG: hypothetical protein A4E28_03032 [Methanocella sp. PtaU1.Bin125]
MCNLMKIYKPLADIYMRMPSFLLRLTGVAIVAATVGIACICPAPAAAADGYPAVVKVLGGGIATAGSGYLAAAIGRTFLRSGGIAAFKGAYLAAVALAGPGLAEIISAFRPASVGHALLAWCLVSIASGALWVRFYGRAA